MLLFLSKQLYENVITQNKDYLIDTKKTRTIKNELSTKKISNYKVKLGEVGNSVKEKKTLQQHLEGNKIIKLVKRDTNPRIQLCTK